MQPLSSQSLPLTPSAFPGRHHSSVQRRGGWVVRTFLPALACHTRRAACAASPATWRCGVVQRVPQSGLQPVPEALRFTVWYQRTVLFEYPKRTFVCSFTNAVFLVVTKRVQGWLFHDRLFLSCLICIRYPLYALNCCFQSGNRCGFPFWA